MQFDVMRNNPLLIPAHIPLAPEFRKNSFNPAGKLQLFRSVKLIETHGIMKITKKFTLYKIE